MTQWLGSWELALLIIFSTLGIITWGLVREINSSLRNLLRLQGGLKEQNPPTTPEDILSELDRRTKLLFELSGNEALKPQLKRMLLAESSLLERLEEASQELEELRGDGDDQQSEAWNARVESALVGLQVSPGFLPQAKDGLRRIRISDRLLGPLRYVGDKLVDKLLGILNGLAGTPGSK